MAKGYASQLATLIPFTHHHSLCSYLLDYSVLFHEKVMFHHFEHSKHLYIHDIPSQYLTLQTLNHFSAAHDGKINDCGF